MGRAFRKAMMLGVAYRKVGGTWDSSKKGGGVTLSSGNLQAAGNGSALSVNSLSARTKFSLTVTFTTNVWIGIGRADMNVSTFLGGGDGRSIGITQAGDIYYGGVVVGNTGQTVTSGGIMTAIVDTVAGTIKIAINGGAYCTPINYGGLGLTGTLYAGAAVIDGNAAVANFS